MAFIYIIGVLTNPVKIGHARNVEHRLMELQIGNADELIVHYKIGVPRNLRSVDVESGVHADLWPHWRRGEWFDIEASEAAEAANAIIENMGCFVGTPLPSATRVTISTEMAPAILACRQDYQVGGARSRAIGEFILSRQTKLPYLRAYGMALNGLLCSGGNWFTDVPSYAANNVRAVLSLIYEFYSGDRSLAA